jgi:hypothetical protein
MQMGKGESVFSGIPNGVRDLLSHRGFKRYKQHDPQNRRSYRDPSLALGTSEGMTGANTGYSRIISTKR